MINNLDFRKKQVEKEIAAIIEEEMKIESEAIKQNNFARFKNRCADWIIGKAHLQFDFQDNGCNEPQGEILDSMVLPSCVHINGNCGKSYSAVAQVTSATNTYFHNVIPTSYRLWFQVEIIKLTNELMKKVLGDPACVIELMGLQNISLKLDNYFPAENIEEVKSDLTRSQDEVLNKFTVEQLNSLRRLSHGNAILHRHLADRENSVKA